MNARILGVLISKDLTLYFRNRFFAFITVLGLVIYIALYTLLPASVDEMLTIAVYAPGIPAVFINFLNSSDINIASFESDEALRQAITDVQYPAGIVLTGDVIGGIARGQPTEVTIYLASDAPQEAIDAIRSVLGLALNRLSYTLSGDPLQVEFHEQFVGPDMTGQQLAIRNRLLPLLAVMLLVLEMMGLGTLIAEEVEARTLPALLVTPATVTAVFTSKAVLGILLGFTQAAILMALTGSLRHEPLLLLVTLLLGGLVVTGLAFLIASASRSMIGAMAWGILIIIVMMIPSYGVIFPGTATNWAHFVPSYYMFDTIHQVVNFGASWAAVGSNLVVLLVMGLALLAAGVLVMERKMR